MKSGRLQEQLEAGALGIKVSWNLKCYAKTSAMYQIYATEVKLNPPSFPLHPLASPPTVFSGASNAISAQ